MPTEHEVNVIGIGLTTSLGHGAAANLKGMQTRKPQYQSHSLPLFDESIEAAYLTIDLGPSIKSAEQRMRALLDTAVTEALQDAQISLEEQQEMAIFIGSSSYSISIVEERYQNDLLQQQKPASDAGSTEPFPLRIEGLLYLNEHLQQEHGLLGADFSYNTACTSSANAILSAQQSLSSGSHKNALVIGLEVFNITTLSGFAGMQLLAKEAMRPFDPNRNGMVLGEGCGVIVLQADAHNDLKICGGASQCDTFSIAASNPDGSEIAKVMRLALDDANLTDKDICIIKAHGAASTISDKGEAAGMHQVFSSIPPLFCLKPYVGHTLGACAAIEMALLVTSLRENQIPASAGFEEQDPELEITLETEIRPAATGYYMLNFFGFGGNNCSLVLHNTINGSPKPLREHN